MIEDLKALRLSPEQVANVEPLRRRRKTRVPGDFYLCPVKWANDAAIAVASAKGLLIALRLYRRGRMCNSEDGTIVASNVILGTGPLTREIKRRVISRLEKAGLLEIVEQKKGRAPRVRIVE